VGKAQWAVSKEQKQNIFDKNVLSKGFLITSKYAFCSARIALSYED
jgi:hypothetical protein